MSDGSGPWRHVNPASHAKPVGYSYAVVSQGGRHVHLAGHVAMNADGVIEPIGDLVAQTRTTMEALRKTLEEAGGRPEHLVRMRIYVMSADDYARNSREIGMLYRQEFGKHFPAMTLVQVARLFEKGALVEIEADAVIPDHEAL